MKKTFRTQDTEKGFTLLEMIVAVALFAVVMLVSVGALLSLVAASKKAQSLHLVVNNLNIALDAMVRSIRMGSSYNCNSAGIPNPGGGNCSEGGTLVSFTPFGEDPAVQSARWVYRYDVDGAYCGERRICRSVDGGQEYLAVTASTVDIEGMSFYVVGTDSSDTDNNQPKVVVVIRGKAGADNVRTVTEFNIQSTAVQRVLDL